MHYYKLFKLPFSKFFESPQKDFIFFRFSCGYCPPFKNDTFLNWMYFNFSNYSPKLQALNNLSISLGTSYHNVNSVLCDRCQTPLVSPQEISDLKFIYQKFIWGKGRANTTNWLQDEFHKILQGNFKIIEKDDAQDFIDENLESLSNDIVRIGCYFHTIKDPFIGKYVDIDNGCFSGDYDHLFMEYLYNIKHDQFKANAIRGDHLEITGEEIINSFYKWKNK